MKKDDTRKLTKLGHSSKHQYKRPNVSILETFLNKFTTSPYLVIHTCPEFTSLCPKTGQPDFGNIVIQYQPDQKCIESKSLKLYLGAFRNSGTFMETIVNTIRQDISKQCKPHWLKVAGAFVSRGGIQTTVESESGKYLE